MILAYVAVPPKVTVTWFKSTKKMQPRKIRDGSLESGRMGYTSPATEPLRRHLLYLASDLTNCASGGSTSNTPSRKIWEVKGGLNHG